MRYLRFASGAVLAVAIAATAGAASAQRWHRHMWDDHGGMMGPGPGYGMMGRGMMGLGLPLMFAMLDTDGDGAVSLEEMQAVQKRMFDLVDKNKDGKITIDEVRGLWGSMDSSQP